MRTAPTRRRATPALRTMRLRDAPDLLTAIAAGEAHGLTPRAALKSAFGKWLTEHADDVQRYGLANFYKGKRANRAMVDQTQLLRFVLVMLVEQGREIARLHDAHAPVTRRQTLPRRCPKL